MTEGERQLIASLLVDKGLPPYDGGVLDPTALENLTEREREVFGEFFFEEVGNVRADLEAFLKVARPSVSKFERLKFWLSARWFQGLSYWQVQMMSGHKDPKTVMRYDHGRENLDQNAVNFLNYEN